MGRHLGDPEAADKLKLSHDYLDKMIKGEYIQIKSLNDKIDKFIRYDFVEKEVTGERRLVQVEDELMHLRIKEETINLNNIRVEKKRSEYEEKIAKADAELKKLKAELEEEKKHHVIRDIKPLLAQKFLGQAYHKMKSEVAFYK